MGNLPLPKALLEIEGRTLIENTIETLKAIGTDRIVIVVGHLGNQIEDFIRGRDFGIELQSAAQETPLGLAHAIATARDQIDNDFVVLCPDNLYTDQADLLHAREVFESREPAFILLATVAPNRQRDRKSYFTSARHNLEENVYEYQSHDNNASGLAINSTGCCFFKDVTREHEALIYLLRGMRYDFSAPADVEQYLALKKRLSETSGLGVSAILINRLGQVLLQQRDDNPAIRYPGHWSLFGGTIEEDESPAMAAAREVKEEIDYDMQNFGLFREFVQNNKHEFAFVGELSAELDELTLNEGQGMNLFYPSQLHELQIRPDDRETLTEYFGV